MATEKLEPHASPNPRRQSAQYYLLNFMESQIARLKICGRLRTSETYRQALNSFRRFLSATGNIGRRSSCDIRLKHVTGETMESYEAWLKARGNVPNTVSFYMRILRAVYNRAVEQDMTVDRKPFRRVYTGVDKTVKRALPLKTIRKIKTMDLTHCPKADFARDMFMLSFYLCGMSLIDMAYLKKSDLHDGVLVYRRQKTGRRISIRWTAEMQAVLDKYDPNPTDYMLPIITSEECDPRLAYRRQGYNINRNLKIVGRYLNPPVSLTLYCSRHSWASAARSNGVAISVISEALGHDNESTTNIYLASLDTSAVDSANRLILGLL